MRYDVIDHWRLDDFLRMVNEALSDGWVLVGGVSISDNSVNRHWCQAVTKESK